MTTCIIVSKECNCNPDKSDTWKKRLAVIEGQTVVYLCPHVDAFIKRNLQVWEKSGV